MGKTPTRSELEKERARETKALIRLDARQSPNYRAAEKLWQEARRNASSAEVVTSWSGVVQ